jgi:hypothetical protein
VTGEEAVELLLLVRPRTAIPVHYEGWKHFRQGRPAIEKAFAADGSLAPTWLEHGKPAVVAT